MRISTTSVAIGFRKMPKGERQGTRGPRPLRCRSWCEEALWGACRGSRSACMWSGTMGLPRFPSRASCHGSCPLPVGFTTLESAREKRESAGLQISMISSWTCFLNDPDPGKRPSMSGTGMTGAASMYPVVRYLTRSTPHDVRLSRARMWELTSEKASTGSMASSPCACSSNPCEP